MGINVCEIMDTISFLTEDIGVRLAGSENEKRAANFLRDRFLEATKHCRIEEFPVMMRNVRREYLKIHVDGKWEKYPCSLYTSAVGTGGKEIAGDIVFFDGHTGYQMPDISHLKGRAVIYYGPHPGGENEYRRLMEAKPAFLLMVDTRHTGEAPLADGLFPSLVKKYGSVPTVSVAFQDAWKWIGHNADGARLLVEGGMVPSFSQNVVAEIPGQDKQCIYLGAHHDTQAGTPGADDNAIACGILVGMCKELARQKHRHTIRLISFGAEEQLSLGSSAYVRKHKAEMSNGRFMCNFDSCGSCAGWNFFVISAGQRLSKIIRDTYNGCGIYYQAQTEPEPFTDQFPFAAAGVPGITLERGNCETGIFYHHRFDNTIDKISPQIALELASASAKLVLKLADMENLDAVCTIPAAQQRKIDILWKNIFE